MISGTFTLGNVFSFDCKLFHLFSSLHLGLTL